MFLIVRAVFCSMCPHLDNGSKRKRKSCRFCSIRTLLDYFLCNLSLLSERLMNIYFLCLLSGFVLSLVAFGQRYDVLSLKHCVSHAGA